ncbi:hypothetical protein Lal_00032733 [Lupinus albus]|nr:hypothetical protein Lal_00032733 [Lupinus albus]
MSTIRTIIKIRTTGAYPKSIPQRQVKNPYHEGRSKSIPRRQVKTHTTKAGQNPYHEGRSQSIPRRQPFTTSGLLDVFEKHVHGDPDLLDKLTSDMRIYKDDEFDFGRPVAIRERSKVMSDPWWETYGCRTPNLQKLAVRVLSQTCSASCERNWSVFEHIHTNKRNRLELPKLNDLVFVRYNLMLQQRSHLRHQNYDPINLEIFEDHSHFILEESPPFLTVEEVEALRNDLANISIQPSLDDNDQLNLEDDDDDAQLNLMENVNLDEDNVGQASGSNDEEIEPQYETTLTLWC